MSRGRKYAPSMKLVTTREGLSHLSAEHLDVELVYLQVALGQNMMHLALTLPDLLWALNALQVIRRPMVLKIRMQRSRLARSLPH
jgi:hypothetical protein